MNSNHYKSQRWWPVPLLNARHGKSPWSLGLLMFAVLFFVPQGARAALDWDDENLFHGYEYNRNSNGSDPTISFEICYWDWYGTDEGFCVGDGLKIFVSKDGKKTWELLYNIKCFQNSNASYSSVKNLGITEGSHYENKHYQEMMPLVWHLPLQWRDSKIYFKSEGYWAYKDGDDEVWKSKTYGPYTTNYSHHVRSISWNSDYTFTADGRVTVNYKFGEACNTDGDTHICTRIDGKYNSTIGYKYPSSNYSAGSYTFNLSDIGKNMCSQFTIEPYHEFTHTNDMDKGDGYGTEYYVENAGAKTFYALPVATINSVDFDQEKTQVTLNWTASNANYRSGSWGTKWVIYRNDKKLGTVPQESDTGKYSYVDKNVPTEENLTYVIYYVWRDWNETAMVDELKSNSKTVNTTRTVPIVGLTGKSYADRIEFTWNSDGYPVNWGNKFKIYVDEETSPIYTFTPGNNQSEFTWVHKTCDPASHSNRKEITYQLATGKSCPGCEEPLNACIPHNYRIEGWIGNTKLSEATLEKKAIGSGTSIYSMDATKGSYPGVVKLSWHVNMQGSKNPKTYVIERQRAESESDPWATIHRMSSADDYLLYTDDTPLPGVYYNYRVTVIDICEDGAEVRDDITAIGFAQTTGTISGRVTYGSSGTSVAGVDVEAKMVSSSGENAAQYYGMKFTNTSGFVTWNYPSNTYAASKFSTGDFSIQLWIRPEQIKDNWIVRFDNPHAHEGSTAETCVALSMFKNGQKVLFCDGTKNCFFDLSYKAGEYQHVTLTRKGTELICYLIQFNADGTRVVKKDTTSVSESLDLTGAIKFSIGALVGYVDDFRLWTKCLTEDEVLENFDHLLVGNEKGLETYWTFDEGLTGQFFDYSRNGTVYNQHHGVIGRNVGPTNVTPSALTLKAKTDTDGNYIIQGVPFSGEGTTYAIIPQLNNHDFNPTQQLRFVSNNSLVHNATDFEDVSSFPVSGKIMYSGTTYPVEGVNFYVDGVVCSKDGELVTTNSEGEYTISVPIGKHFIQAKKSGHVFVNDGRYPADPVGDGQAKHKFDRPITGLDFRDTTLVNFTGRVVGGDIEGKPAVGFGLSNNNIGVAELVLTPVFESPMMNAVKEGETTVEYNYSKVKVDVPSATDFIKSTSWRGFGNMPESKKIYIDTDPHTGEFSALLPPVEYKMSDITVKKTGDIVGPSSVIDLSNPLREESDTLYTDSIHYTLFKYNTKLNQIYHSVPTFNVVQDGRSDKAFGIDSTKYVGPTDTVMINDIIAVDKLTDEVTYKYGGPIFVMEDPYTFKLHGYEEYTNYDKSPNNVTSIVPLSGTVVTISNALSADQTVYLEDGTDDGRDVKAGETVGLKRNQLVLDSLGKAVYKWRAGMPNVAKPYTRTISMSYDINGRGYNWRGKGLEGIVLGDLPTGNNFVTSGPDKLNMILRDPPGTGSSAEWSSGSSTTRSTVLGNTMGENFGLTFAHKYNVKLQAIQGTVAPGGGAMTGTISEFETKEELEAGATMESELEDSETTEVTTTITHAVATSEEPDFVGADGDVFIGQATNIIFGNARQVGFQKTDDGFEIGLDEIISTGLQFSTMFNYSQSYIENTLFPNLEKLRDNLLEHVESQSVIDNFVNDGERTRYFTLLTPDSAHYAEENTYTVFLPKSMTNVPKFDNPVDALSYAIEMETVVTDSVKWINSQMDTWKKILAFNEEEKAKAYKMRENGYNIKYQNYSFDGGASVSHSIEKDSTYTSTREWSVSAGLVVNSVTGFEVNNVGFDMIIADETIGGRHEVHEDSENYNSSFSYTLAEEGSDAISVDVYEYGAYSPIFRTRGGQTCNPYEGEVRATYYEDKGTHPILMEATMQIEVPTIGVDVNEINDIPSGSAANYTLRLGNESEIGEDVAYRIFFLDETNPDGAMLTIDGKALTAEGRLIKVPGNQTLTKALQLRQTNTGVLNYDGCTDEDNELYGLGIGIVFASDSQPEDIADTVFIKAHFTPSSSPVTLALSTRTMNTQTGTDLVLTMKDFDRNYHNLKALRLQYKKQGAAVWTRLKEYMVNDEEVEGDKEKLPEGATVSFTKPMSAFSDGNYLFRCESAATYGNGEVYRYSEEIPLVKDMQKPRPLGQPEPTDGVLDIGDELSVSFNETILKGELLKENNFSVTGVLNGAEIGHETALSMDSGTAKVAAASTEATINLANKDFSIDAWVNISGTGTLLSHGVGSNKLTIGVDKDGYLEVGIGSKTYTSSNIMPVDDWAFLTMNLTADGKLSASVATADETVHFFDNMDVDAYTGNGPLAVGKNLKGAIHELLLWDEAHDLSVALANRSKTKAPSTRHLIGYWKMNEGEGTSIRDYARSRHLSMPDETWYINNENLAVRLDGQSFIRINTSMLPVTYADDYAVEFWMRGDVQGDSAQLVQMGDVSLGLSSDGQLLLTGMDADKPASAMPLETTSGILTDNAWHHVALNVLHQGAAAVYVDGKRCLTTSASNVGGINGDRLVVGARRVYGANIGGVDPYTYDHPFKGEVDEIRVWGATMNAELLANNRKVRFTGKEDGLIAYYPFETKTIDDYNQIITDGIDSCLVSKRLNGVGCKAEFLSLTKVPLTASYTEEAPALRAKPVETNVNFTYVASDEKIVIELDEDPATIEGCTLNFTVKNLSDENGNYSDPAKWSAYINQKELVWEDDELGTVCHVDNATNRTLTATIVNKGGKQQMWTLDGMPSWLQASNEYGITNPRSRSTVTFTVSPATPIGKYEETIYLKDNEGIETPLTINVKVKGEEPGWTVNASDYDGSMNIISNLFVLSQMSEDEDDLVGAFIDGQCRGVARPVYDNRYDSYFVTMDVYGKSPSLSDPDDNGDTNKDIEFKVYDASTGIIYPVVKAYQKTPGTANGQWSMVDVQFSTDNLVGRFADPMKLSATDEVEQNIDLAKGWNWMSLSVKPEVFSVENVFSKANGKVEFLKNKSVYTEHFGNGWVGKLEQMNNREMYAVQTTDELTLSVTGNRVLSSEEPISVVEGWTWVAFNSLSVMSLADALADMVPQNDEIIKAQRGVAYYDEYEWIGSLKQLTPGQGYKIQGKQARTFTYPVKAAMVSASRQIENGKFNIEDEAATSQSSIFNSQSSIFTPIDYRSYPANMVLIAQVACNGLPVAGVELGVFAGNECREAAVTDEHGMVYITIPGDDPCELTFRVAINGQCSMVNGQSIPYETDAVVGSPRAPFVINLDEASGISERPTANSQQPTAIYDLQGRKVNAEATANGQRPAANSQQPLRKGVYIVNGQKKVK